jgi:hypothetical protein
MFVFSQVPRLNVCTLSAICNFLESQGFRFSLGPLFRRLLKTQPGASALIALKFSLQAASRFVFAPEERDVYSYQHTPKDLAPLGAKPG